MLPVQVGPHILGYGSQGTLVYEGSLHGRPVAVKRMLRHLYPLAKKEIDALILSDEVSLTYYGSANSVRSWQCCSSDSMAMKCNKGPGRALCMVGCHWRSGLSGDVLFSQHVRL